jgi:transcriptional regulator with XRE-family HTH domain
MSKLPDIMREVRFRNRLSQRALGEIMTVSAPYICNIEKGKETPSAMFIKLFCLLYNVNPDELSV